MATVATLDRTDDTGCSMQRWVDRHAASATLAIVRCGVGHVAKAQTSIPSEFQPWIDARRRHHLSHAHVQMARQLGMNPKKLGGLDNHRQEPWKQPLPDFIAMLYAKRFGKDARDVVRSIEDVAAAKQAKKQARRAAKAAAGEAPATDAPG